MDLFLEILDGDDVGTRIPLRAGLTIGRKDCDLNLRDSKVSSRHARVEERADGLLWLVDLGSSNGIRLDGKKVRDLRLDPEASFRIGRVNIRVITSVAFMDSTQPEIVVDDSGTPKPVGKRALRPVEPAPLTWGDRLQALSERALKNSNVKNREVTAFDFVFRLSIKQGIQAGTEWTIGYGPRDVGGNSVDLPLLEKGIPAQCFRLLPRPDEVLLKVGDDAWGKVLINGERAESNFLVNGDKIAVGDTVIEVSIEKANTNAG